MGLFRKKIKLTREQIYSHLDKIENAFLDRVKALVSVSMDIQPIKCKDVYKFESAIFALFRYDYFICELNLNNDKIRLWFNQSVDSHLSSIGSYNPEWVDKRIELYTANLKHLNDAENFYKDFLTISYNTYFGLNRRAASIDEWWATVDMNDDETIQLGGLDVYTRLSSIEECIMIPTLKIVKNSLENIGAI